MLVYALHAAFEDRKVAFDGVGGDVAARVFPARVVSLKDGAHGHGELLAAVLALPEARTVGLALEGVVLAYCTAMGASRAAGLADRL